MAEHRGRVNAVMIGVGAAFDFHASTVQRVPGWMRDNGLEWLCTVWPLNRGACGGAIW
jgi:N-acetylglucosaminyldiphosphoundecaprenol N-acetyl-beta-D-mannosaminyltransferase